MIDGRKKSKKRKLGIKTQYRRQKKKTRGWCLQRLQGYSLARIVHDFDHVFLIGILFTGEEKRDRFEASHAFILAHPFSVDE